MGKCLIGTLLKSGCWIPPVSFDWKKMNRIDGEWSLKCWVKQPWECTQVAAPQRTWLMTLRHFPDMIATKAGIFPDYFIRALLSGPRALLSYHFTGAIKFDWAPGSGIKFRIISAGTQVGHCGPRNGRDQAGVMGPIFPGIQVPIITDLKAGRCVCLGVYLGVCLGVCLGV